MKNIKTTFSTIRQLLHQRSYFKQLLGYYIIVSCAAFLIFSIILLSFMQRQYLNEMSSVNEQNVSQAKAFNNSSLYDINAYCYNLLNNDTTLNKMLYSSDYDTLTALSAREVYNSIMSISSMITSCELINYSTGTVLTLTSRMPLDQFSDQDLLTYIENLTPSLSPVYWIPRVSYSGSDSDGTAVISLIYYTNKRGAMVVNLDYESYVSQLNLSETTGSFEMILLNQYGQVFAATDESLFGSDYTEEALYLEVMAQSSKIGSFTYASNGVRQTIHYSRNDSMGITCISILTSSGLLLRNEMFGLTLRSAVLYLVATLLLSFFASLISYRPIHELRSTISSHHHTVISEPENPNDFAYLKSVYQDLMDKSSTTSYKERLYENEKEERALYALMTNNSTQPYPNTADMENHFEFLYYRIIVTHMEPFDHADTEQPDTELRKFMVHNVSNEIFGSSIILKSIAAPGNDAVFLANFETDEESIFRKGLQKTQQFFDQLGLFELSFGLGATVSELDGLSISYDTARATLAHGMYKSAGCIRFYEDMRFFPIEEQAYPYDKDEALITALKSMNHIDADRAIDAFLDAISRYNYEQIYRYSLQLESTLQRFEYSNHLTFAAKSQDSSPNVQSPDDPLRETEWRIYLKERCSADIDALAEIKMHNKAKDTLVVQVQQIVEENIYNVNLSVTMIAEQVNLSVNYLRNLYKENTGESLSTYISGRKLSLICELLTETDLSIQEISDRLGFATRNYFFTFFKKHMGMTPNQYRKEKGIAKE